MSSKAKELAALADAIVQAWQKCDLWAMAEAIAAYAMLKEGS